MRRTVEVKIGLAVGEDGTWQVASTFETPGTFPKPDDYGSKAADRAAEITGPNSRRVSLTLHVEVPEPVHLTLDVPMPDEKCAVQVDGDEA